MKKIISIFLVFCLLFFVCGCKKAPSEDTAAPLDIVTDTPQDEDTTPETEQDPEQAPVQEQEIVQADKAEPCNLTLENTFSEYEVIVTLTNEETAKGKAYTAEDFKDYDIFYVIENDTYYGNPSMKDSYPEYQGRTTLFLYLNEPSKENVLETVKALEKDERVFAACPNPLPENNKLVLYFTDEYNKELMSLAAEYEKSKQENSGLDRIESYDKFMLNFENKIKEDLCYDEFYSFNVFYYGDVQIVPEIKIKITISESNDNSFTICDALKRYLQDTRITKIIPENLTEYYYTGAISFYVDDPDYDKSKPYTTEDFEKYTAMKIIYIDQAYFKTVGVSLRFEKPTYQQLADTVSKIQNNLKITSLRFSKESENPLHNGSIITLDQKYLF